MRERSVRTNRRHKFVDCLSSQDVNMGTSSTDQFSAYIDYSAVILRKLAWAGIPPDFRPMAWQLLLVSRSIKPRIMG